MAVRPVQLLLLLPALALGASESSSIGHSGSAVASALGAMLLLLVAIFAPVAPVARSLIGVTPSSEKLSAPNAAPASSAIRQIMPHADEQNATTSAAGLCRTLPPPPPPEPVHREASEEELMASEERLLRALGYDPTGADDDGDKDGGGLTEAEIAAFRATHSSAAQDDSGPVRFKDRHAEPLSEIVTRWQQQHDGKEAASGGSPCPKGGGDGSPKQLKAARHANSHGARRGGGGMREGSGRKQRARGVHSAASSGPTVGA